MKRLTYKPLHGARTLGAQLAMVSTLFSDSPYVLTYDQLDPHLKALIEIKPQSAIQRVPGP